MLKSLMSVRVGVCVCKEAEVGGEGKGDAKGPTVTKLQRMLASACGLLQRYGATASDAALGTHDSSCIPL